MLTFGLQPIAWGVHKALALFLQWAQCIKKWGMPELTGQTNPAVPWLCCLPLQPGEFCKRHFKWCRTEGCSNAILSGFVNKRKRLAAPVPSSLFAVALCCAELPGCLESQRDLQGVERTAPPQRWVCSNTCSDRSGVGLGWVHHIMVICAFLLSWGAGAHLHNLSLGSVIQSQWLENCRYGRPVLITVTSSLSFAIHQENLMPSKQYFVFWGRVHKRCE